MHRLTLLIVLNLLVCLVFVGIIKYNQKQIFPTSDEIALFKDVFGDIRVKTKSDILKIQNKVILLIRHKFVSRNQINVKECLLSRSGLCYDRSLILQKILIENGLDIRPVYVFWNTSRKTSCFDIFNKKLQSHSVFEVFYDGNYYLIRTNSLQRDFESIDDYISTSGIVPKHSLFIRNLSNRHGAFLYPKFLPDIY